MGKGQRHSKNAGVMGAEGLSYAERKALGFGTVKERLGKDSIGNFDDCCLTLIGATDPVITPDGYLYSKEAILENLLAQKKAIRRKLAAWEADQQDTQSKASEVAAVQKEARLIAFDRQNHMGISEATASNIRTAIEAEAAALHDPAGVKSVIAIKGNEERSKSMKAFWTPTIAPDALKTSLDKPDPDTHCPASGKKLKMKDLIPVKFTRTPDDDKGRYMDPITKDTFTNASKLVVLKPTGDVVLQETYDKCIKQDGSFNGVKIRERDVIKIQTGGTGFAARDGEKVQASKYWTLGPGSGRQDLRGQHAGPRSLGGLVMNN